MYLCFFFNKRLKIGYNIFKGKQEQHIVCKRQKYDVRETSSLLTIVHQDNFYYNLWKAVQFMEMIDIADKY